MLKKLRKNKKGFTLAELLIVVAIIGVLVAISIPIFTSQLQKARLATNQANARAAYAAATTQYLLEYSDTTPADSVSFTYKDSDGTGAFDTTAKSTGLTGSTTTNISTWDKDTTINGTKLGDKTASEWTVILSKDGNVTGYTATWPTA